MNGERESRRVWWIAAAIMAGLVAWRFLPEAENPLAPEPVSAHVAIAAEGESRARDGRHELVAGRPFRLYAALEARDWRGRTIWYSAAPALSIGGRDVPTESIRPWPAERRVQIRWLTVEPFAPYLAVAEAADLDHFSLIETFHPDWGSGWSATGIVDPRPALLPADSELRPLPFGTQGYALRVELYDEPEALAPSKRWSSVGAAQLGGGGTRVVAALAAPLATVSSTVGRLHLELLGDFGPELEARAAALVTDERVFRVPSLWIDHLAESGRTIGELEWRGVDLVEQRPEWPGEVAAGDLVQSGDRLVILFRDQGEAGRLDPADLVFDAARGLRILRLDQVFRGEEGSFPIEHAASSAR